MTNEKSNKLIIELIRYTVNSQLISNEECIKRIKELLEAQNENNQKMAE